MLINRKLVVLLALVSVAGAAVYTASSRGTWSGVPDIGEMPAAERMVTAPGTVEPISEEIELSSELPGKIDRLSVDEGSPVRAGQVIAAIANRDYEAQVASARAALESRSAALRLVINGARQQEREQALAQVAEADAVLANAQGVRDRRRDLLEHGAVSREETDQAERAYSVAQAQRRAAVERHALIDDPAREEDRASAEAAVAVARAALEQAEATLAKTYIRSPIDGVVLRKLHRVGETVMINSATPDPIVTVGNISRLRVRAEIDEIDVSAIRRGQRVYVRADTFGDRKFYGTIARIGETLGRKRQHTDLPAERLDAKVLEVLVDIDKADGLRPGLRVDVFVSPAQPDGGASGMR